MHFYSHNLTYLKLGGIRGIFRYGEKQHSSNNPQITKIKCSSPPIFHRVQVSFFFFLKVGHEFFLLKSKLVRTLYLPKKELRILILKEKLIFWWHPMMVLRWVALGLHKQWCWHSEQPVWDYRGAPRQSISKSDILIQSQGPFQQSPS